MTVLPGDLEPVAAVMSLGDALCRLRGGGGSDGAAALDNGGNVAWSAAASLAVGPSSVTAEWFDNNIGIDSSPAPRSPPVATRTQYNDINSCGQLQV